jgi:UDP-N-acetylmuramyl pentapeptide phosphotransferase/UDP-N-acetylglucosamine-1-phosphate transferase
MVADLFLSLAALVLLLVAFLATYLIMPWLINALRKAEAPLRKQMLSMNEKTSAAGTFRRFVKPK